jgi:hypothetical protein
MAKNSTCKENNKNTLLKNKVIKKNNEKIGLFAKITAMLKSIGTLGKIR